MPEVFYRVTNGPFKGRAPACDHMEGPTPQHDGIPSYWMDTHPHCVANPAYIEDWWPLELVANKGADWCYFRVVPKNASAYLKGRTQSVVNPHECDIMEMTHGQFINEAYYRSR